MSKRKRASKREDKFEWMPVLVPRLLADTSRLSNEEFGAYLRMLLNGWMDLPKPGRFPKDETALSELAHVAPSRWTRIAPRILTKLKERDDCYESTRMLTVHAHVTQTKKIKEDRARKGGLAKARKDKLAQSVLKQATSMQAETEAEAEADKEKEKNGEGLNLAPKPGIVVSKSTRVAATTGDNFLDAMYGKPPIPDALRSAEFERVWESYLEMRIADGSALRPASQREQLSKLSKISVDQAIAAVSNTIANGYKGIVIPRDSATPTTGTSYTEQSLGRMKARLAKITGENK